MDNLMFRFFPTEGISMFEVFGLNLKDKEIYCGELPSGEEVLFDIKDGTLMQATGLKDKCGTDIFEGDIVRWDDCTNGRCWRVAVVERKREIQFRIIRIKCDYEQSAKEGYVFRFGSFAYADTEHNLEVIGNIYENADLLIK